MPFHLVVTLFIAADGGPTAARRQEHALIITRDPSENVFVADAALFLDAKRLNPVTAEEINTFLEAEQLKDILGCEDVACYADVGGALDIKYVLQIEPNKKASRAVLSLFALFPQPKKVQSKLVSHETALQSLLRSADDFRKKRDSLAAVLERIPCGYPWKELQEAIGRPHHSDVGRRDEADHFYFDLRVSVVGGAVRDIGASFGKAGGALINCRRLRQEERKKKWVRNMRHGTPSALPGDVYLWPVRALTLISRRGLAVSRTSNSYSWSRGQITTT